MIPKSDFKIEVIKWSNIVGVKPKEIHIREMNKKLASCSSKGRLTFSYSLLNMNYEERSKIIIHELLHLRYPTHNKMFKILLTTYTKKFL